MPKIMNTEQFIERAIKVHGDKYDYSKVKYVNSRTKVCINCPKHGEFWQTPNNHLSGNGCPSCASGIQKDTKWFIEKARRVHGDKYDYSKVEYADAFTKVCIICPKHGEFWQSPTNHTHKTHPRGCPKCNGGLKATKDEFIKKARKVHEDKYDYSKVEYFNASTKVCIVCPKHGEFWQTPNAHLHGNRCPKCWSEIKPSTLLSNKEEFVKKARKVHGDRYDYSKVEYVNAATKVCIICPEHGEFWQTPTHHLGGQGCKKCTFKIYNKDSFIERAREVYGNKYDYSKVEYVDTKTKVCIICPKHGEFKVTPNAHVIGKVGCPLCNRSHLEEEIALFLDNEGIQYDSEKKFEWLGKQELDFYLPQHNIAIECQGIQHFEKREFFKEPLEAIQDRDLRKYKLCKENGVKLLYYSNLGIEYPYKVFEDKEELLKEIKS